MNRVLLACAIAAALWLCVLQRDALAAPAMHLDASMLLADGRIVVVGRSADTSIAPHLTLGRFNADGSLDTTFGNGGWLDYFSMYWMQPMAEFQPTAAMVVNDPWAGSYLAIAARYDGQTALIELTTDGQPNWSFGYGGIIVDADSGGMQVDALLYAGYQTILAVGAYTGTETGGVPTAGAVRYFSGWRDYSFSSGPRGMALYTIGAGASEFRAAIPAWDGWHYVAAGFASNGTNRNFMVARFDGSGVLDPSFGNGGSTLLDLFAGHDNEAFAIAPGDWGSVVAAGRDGHTFFGLPQSGFAVARFDSGGHPDSSFGWGGYINADVHVRDFHDGDATAVSVSAIPGSTDLLVAGTVAEYYTGHTHFASWRLSPQMPWMSSPVSGPLATDDDRMLAAYPNDAGQFVAAGTRTTAAGDVPLRVRYFSDTGAFDTDFAGDP